MGPNDFTHFEREALLEFLEDNLNKDSLSIYQGYLIKHLFLAYLKLRLEEKNWQESMAYTE